MNSLALRDNYSVQNNKNLMPTVQEMKELTTICQTLAQAPFYAKLGAGGVLGIWLTARELNLPPMLALNGGLYNIDGKVSMSAQLMNMMIINAGHKIDVLYLNDEGCRIKFTRVYKNGTEKSDEYEFNKKDAERAKYFGEIAPNGNIISKPKANWVMYPRDMYFSRAISGGSKKFLPDVMMNCYAFGEIQDIEEEKLRESHEYISNIVPLNDTAIQPEQIRNDDKPAITDNELITFKEKFGIGKESDHEKYLKVISEKCQKSTDEMIVCAAMNETGFINAFEKWKAAIDKKDVEKNQSVEIEN